MIRSRNNPLIRKVRKLLSDSSFRDEEREYVIEGVKIISDLLLSPSTQDSIVSSIIFSEKLKHQGTIYETDSGDSISFGEMLRMAGKKRIPCIEVSDSLMGQMKSLKTDQGLIVIAQYIDRSFDEIMDRVAPNMAKGKPLFIGACGIQDPGNLGALMRTAHAGGASALFLFENCADIYNPKTVRGSMGSILSIPFARNLSGEEILPLVRKAGIKICGTFSHSARRYTDVDLDTSLLLLFGSEGRGIPESYMKHIDEALSIPMLGGADSLNVNASAAVIIFERLRRSGERGFA